MRGSRAECWSRWYPAQVAISVWARATGMQIHALASRDSLRCADDTAMMTLGSSTFTTPVRWPIAIFITDHLARTCWHSSCKIGPVCVQVNRYLSCLSGGGGRCVINISTVGYAVILISFMCAALCGLCELTCIFLTAIGTYASYSSLSTAFPWKLFLVTPLNVEIAPAPGSDVQPV